MQAQLKAAQVDARPKQTNDSTWNVWQDGIQVNLITSLSNNPEKTHHECKNVRHREAGGNAKYRRPLATISDKFAIDSYLM